jgi:glycerol-3-phosphate dehydrogenase subunit B
MTEEVRHVTAGLAVIGSGLAGCAASIFALNRGIATAQTGNTGAIAYTTGYLDLLGHNTDASSPMLADPWTGIENLRAAGSDHPLARVSESDTRQAFTEFIDFLAEGGISYTAPGQENLVALTPAGTTKPTLCMPITMQAGAEALARKAPCLIVDFKGLRGFSARQIVANLAGSWPGLRAEHLIFPGLDHGEIYPEVMGRALEVTSTREQLAAILKDKAGDAEAIGMPAIMGMHRPDDVMAELVRLVGRPLFEIPTMPPSVAGIRLREMFEERLPQKGLTLIPQQKISGAVFAEDEVILQLTDNFGPILIHAQTVLLATGRFLSGGLEARRDTVVEPLLGLFVNQPESREEWYRLDYLDRRGHGIHRCGIEVDDQFRPLDATGRVVDPRLFAAGVILAHQDWIRGRCGAGVAIASAYKAVQGVARVLEARNNDKRKPASA